MGEDILKTNVCGLNGRTCGLDDYPGCDNRTMGPMNELPMEEGASVNEWVKTLDGVGGVCNAGGGLWKVYYRSDGTPLMQDAPETTPAEEPKPAAPAVEPAVEDEAEDSRGWFDGALEAVTEFAVDHGYKVAIAAAGLGLAVFGVKRVLRSAGSERTKKPKQAKKAKAPKTPKAQKPAKAAKASAKKTDTAYDIAEELARIMRVHDQLAAREVYKGIPVRRKVDLASAIAGFRDLPNLGEFGVGGYDFASGRIQDNIAEVAVDGLGKIIIGGHVKPRDAKRLRKKYLKIREQVYDILRDDSHVRREGISPQELAEYSELWARRLMIERHIFKSSDPKQWRHIKRKLSGGVFRRGPLPYAWIKQHLMRGRYMNAKDPSFDHAMTVNMKAPLTSDAPTPPSGTPRPPMLQAPEGASEAYRDWFEALEPKMQDLFLRFPKKVTDVLERDYDRFQLRVVERWIQTQPTEAEKDGRLVDVEVRHLMMGVHQVMFGKLPDEGAQLQSAAMRGGERPSDAAQAPRPIPIGPKVIPDRPDGDSTVGVDEFERRLSAMRQVDRGFAALPEHEQRRIAQKFWTDMLKPGNAERFMADGRFTIEAIHHWQGIGRGDANATMGPSAALLARMAQPGTPIGNAISSIRGAVAEMGMIDPDFAQLSPEMQRDVADQLSQDILNNRKLGERLIKDDRFTVEAVDYWRQIVVEMKRGNGEAPVDVHSMTSVPPPPDAKPEPEAAPSQDEVVTKALTGEAAIILSKLHEEFRGSAFDFDALRENDRVALAQGVYETLEAAKRDGTWREYLEVDKKTNKSRFKPGALRKLFDRYVEARGNAMVQATLKEMRDERREDQRGRGRKAEGTGKAKRPGFFSRFRRKGK